MLVVVFGKSCFSWYLDGLLEMERAGFYWLATGGATVSGEESFRARRSYSLIIMRSCLVLGREDIRFCSTSL